LEDFLLEAEAVKGKEEEKKLMEGKVTPLNLIKNRFLPLYFNFEKKKYYERLIRKF
jgi:hypothetical protein